MNQIHVLIGFKGNKTNPKKIQLEIKACVMQFGHTVLCIYQYKLHAYNSLLLGGERHCEKNISLKKMAVIDQRPLDPGLIYLNHCAHFSEKDLRSLPIRVYICKLSLFCFLFIGLLKTKT